MTAVDHAELKRVAEGEASWSLGIYKNRDQADDAAKFRAMDLPAVVLALLSEIEGLKAERRNIVSHATMGTTDGEGLSVNQVSVEITRLRNELYARTQAPDSWKPDRYAVVKAVRDAVGHFRMSESMAEIAADAIAALRPQTAESGE